MFTLKHMNKVLGEVKGLKVKSVFSPHKNALAYKLSTMNSQYRGTIVEKMVRDFFISRGDKVRYFGGNSPFDMIVNGSRIEVKSALPWFNGSGACFYRFQNIKTDLFDKIYLVYVTPYGLKIKSFSSDKMARLLKNHANHCNGKTFSCKAA